jgi:hypothetical protein
MRSSRTITLFSDRPDPFVSGSSFVVSILMHGAVIGVVALAILYGPQTRVVTERYPVRHLELHAPEPQARASAGSGVAYPGPHAKAKTPAPGGKETAQAAALRQTAQGAPGAQTLVQPKIKNPVTLAKEIPIPTALIWSPEKTEVKTIVPPKPAPPTASEVKPSLDPPNEEVNLADLGISASELASPKQPIVPSTTSPIVVHGPERAQLPPATTSESAAQPTPTSVMSLSDMRLANGTVTLPPVNETVSKSSPGALAPGQGKDTAQTGNGNSTAKADGAGASAGQGAGDKGEKTASAAANGKQNGAKAGAAKGTEAGNKNGAKTGPAQGADSGSGQGPSQGSHPEYAVIKLPKDGEFGAVVVGSSLQDKYPETAELWSGRMAYTAYVHVGLARSWILQYSISREDEAAAGGNITHIEAPWPYNIVRPNITPGSIDADALMIHGFVNQAGRFEQLAVAFPPDFAQAKFVLDTLSKWEFRPATQAGQNVRVEVVLVIPEVPE